MCVCVCVCVCVCAHIYVPAHENLIYQIVPLFFLNILNWRHLNICIYYTTWMSFWHLMTIFFEGSLMLLIGNLIFYSHNSFSVDSKGQRIFFRGNRKLKTRLKKINRRWNVALQLSNAHKKNLHIASYSKGLYVSFQWLGVKSKSKMLACTVRRLDVIGMILKLRPSFRAFRSSKNQNMTLASLAFVSRISAPTPLK